MTKLAKLALALLAELFDNVDKPTVNHINYCYLSDVVENSYSKQSMAI